MGYLVCASMIDGAFDPAVLNALPASLPWRLFHHPPSGMRLLEPIRRTNPNNSPPANQQRFPDRAEFGAKPLARDLSTDLEQDYPRIQQLYRQLLSEKRAVTMPLSIVTWNLLIGRLANARTLSIMSDDDDVDLAVLSSGGRLERLRFQSADQEIRIQSHDTPAEIIAAENGQLHRIAEEETSLFCQGLSQLFGFERNAGAIKLTEIARSNRQAPDESPLRRGADTQAL